jgi:hypothetical protein
VPGVDDAPAAQKVVEADLEKWFDMPSPEISRRMGGILRLRLSDLNIILDGDEWVVSGYALQTAMMGGGTVRKWWGGKRFVEPWLKVLREEPFQYRVSRSSGQIVAKDNNMSSVRRRR